MLKPIHKAVHDTECNTQTWTLGHFIFRLNQSFKPKLSLTPNANATCKTEFNITVTTKLRF